VLVVEAARGLKELLVTERRLGRMQRTVDHWAIASDMNDQLPLNRQVVITADEGIDGDGHGASPDEENEKKAAPPRDTARGDERTK
jgi:hypothetical protein